MRTLWSEGLTQKYPSLSGNVKSMVAIVGGSFSGLATANYLMDRGYRGEDISIVEGDVIGVQGGRSIGLVASSNEVDYMDLKKELSPEEAKEYWKSNVDAVNRVRNIIEKRGLNCIDGYGSQFLNTEDNAEYLNSEFRARIEAGFNSAFGKSGIKMNGYDYALSTPDDFVINPAKYCSELAESLSKRGCRIYEKTEINGLDSKNRKITAENGSIESEAIVLAGQRVPKQFGYGAPTLPSRTIPMETYLLATEPLTEKQINDAGLRTCGSFWNEGDNYIYGRMAGNRLIFAGEYLLRPLSGILRERKIKRLERRFRESFPQLSEVKIEQKYAGPIDTTIDETPVVDNPEEGIYTIGASEGMSTSTTSGQIVADMIAGVETENPYKPRGLWETTKMIGKHPVHFAKLGARMLGL